MAATKNSSQQVPDFPRPYTTVDVVIFTVVDAALQVLLVQRPQKETEPFPALWALPGGFVDYGECYEDAARREAEEETGLRVTLSEQFHTYSDPKRDARQHTASTVFIATASGFPVAADDAKRAEVFRRDTLPALAFDHTRILSDYFQFKETGRRPRPDRD